LFRHRFAQIDDAVFAGNLVRLARFVPRLRPGRQQPDEIPSENGVVDLGEAVAEQLALALDPYPRAPGAAMPEETDDAAAERHPMAALAKLRPANGRH
jgi:hypothetical protein